MTTIRTLTHFTASNMNRRVEALANATPSPLVTTHRLSQLIETYKFAAPHQETTDCQDEEFRRDVAFIWFSAMYFVAGADKTLYRFNRSLGQIQQDWKVDILTKVHSRFREIILKEELYEPMRRVDKLEGLLKRMKATGVADKLP